MAMILVTHDLGVVAGRADDIAVMYAGPGRRAGADRDAVRRHAHAVHRGAAEVDPEARAAEPHPARRDRRPAARPRQPAAGLQVRAALPVRAGRSASTRSRRSIDAEIPGHALPLLLPGRHAEAGTTRSARNLAAGETATGLPVRKRRRRRPHRGDV